MNPMYDAPFVPAEPSSLTLMLSGVATLAVYMWYTGLWRNGLRPKPAVWPRTNPITYAYCDYERQFAQAFANLMNVATVDRLAIQTQ